MDHNQFSLIRTREEFANGEAVVIKQSMYHAFDYLSNTNHQKMQLTNFNPEEWLGNNYDDSLTHHFWAYLNDDASKLILNFLNQNNEELILPLSTVNFDIYKDSSFLITKNISSYIIQYLDAESMLSSNKGCSDYPEYFDDYTLIDNNDNQDEVSLPAFSFGKIEFELSELGTGITQNYNTPLKIYPNPSDQSFTLKSDHPNKNQIIQIIDALGKIHLQLSMANHQNIIDVSGLSNGFYTIIVLDELKNQIGTQNLVVNHK